MHSSFRTLFVVMLSFFPSLSMAKHYYYNNTVPPATFCDTTEDPAYCKTLLANQYGTGYDYGRICVQKSVSQSHSFLNLMDSYLQDGSSYDQNTIRALEDCRFLAELNLDFLYNTQETVNKSSNVLQSSHAEDIVTQLSATLTNQQTCLDGLQTTASDERVKSYLSSMLSNDTKLHSMSLCLFRRGWAPEKKIKHSWKQNGRLPYKMPKRVRDMYDSGRGRHGNHGRHHHLRKLLQTESVNVRDMVVVSKDGSGNFTTINAAISAAPNNTASSDGYFLVFIKKGVYEEYVSIAKNKKHLMLVGDGINQTIITGDRNVVDGSTTFNSATFAVVGQGFVAVNITFRNTAGPSKHQAVALRSGADLSAFYMCSFEGYQDTLYTHSMRQFYSDCHIYGTVDFIFGNAAVVFQNCNIFPRLPMTGQFNSITAQGRTDPNQNTGISIHNATIRAADDLAPRVGVVKTYLGRPWKQYSRTVFMESFMDGFVDPAGWHDWSGSFALNTLYYAEHKNAGSGSSTASRVSWPGYHVIGAMDAANFTVSNFLQGDSWLPQTGVPFLNGLI
ncbi:pectinesterase-like [Arachis hypogaea]|nr:pectinesterase-like [Arachis hypogaea]